MKPFIILAIAGLILLGLTQITRGYYEEEINICQAAYEEVEALESQEKQGQVKTLVEKGGSLDTARKVLEECYEKAADLK